MYTPHKHTLYTRLVVVDRYTDTHTYIYLYVEFSVDTYKHVFIEMEQHPKHTLRGPCTYYIGTNSGVQLEPKIVSV